MTLIDRDKVRRSVSVSSNKHSALGLALLLCCSACNHLFYYPDQRSYATPKALEIAYRDLAIETADGLRLHAWLMEPQGTPKGTIVHFHGNAQNIS